MGAGLVLACGLLDQQCVYDSSNGYGAPAPEKAADHKVTGLGLSTTMAIEPGFPVSLLLLALLHAAGMHDHDVRCCAAAVLTLLGLWVCCMVSQQGCPVEELVAY